MNIAGGILAGGKSRRMGLNKAFIKIDGVPVVEKAISVLKKIFEEVIVITNYPDDYKAFSKDCLIVTDIIKGRGPLGGIHAGLFYTTKKNVFFSPCDMPFLHNDVIRKQVEYFKKAECDVFVPRINSFIEPLHAIYKKDLVDTIFSFVDKNKDHSIKNFLNSVNTCYWQLEESDFYKKVFKNLNTPQDVKNLLDK